MCLCGWIWSVRINRWRREIYNFFISFGIKTKKKYEYSASVGFSAGKVITLYVVYYYGSKKSLSRISFWMSTSTCVMRFFNVKSFFVFWFSLNKLIKKLFAISICEKLSMHLKLQTRELDEILSHWKFYFPFDQEKGTRLSGNCKLYTQWNAIRMCHLHVAKPLKVLHFWVVFVCLTFFLFIFVSIFLKIFAAFRIVYLVHVESFRAKSKIEQIDLSADSIKILF